MAAPITRFRVQQLSCFSNIHHAAKPFFKQWHIHALDVSRIMSVPYADARQVMSSLRSFYGKTKTQAITVDEFCAYTRIGKGYVRMHLVARVIEEELKKQAGKSRMALVAGNSHNLKT